MDINISALTGRVGAPSSTAGLLPSRTSPPVANSPAPAATPPASTSAPVPAQQPSRQELQNAVDHANTSLVNRPSNELRFTLEEGAGMSVIKLIDIKTGDAIMQFPSQVMLEIAKTIDSVTGAIIKHKA